MSATPTVARRSLASTFAADLEVEAQPRSAGLVGLLPPRPEPIADSAGEEPVRRAAPRQPRATETKPRPAAPHTPTGPAPAPAAADVVRSVAVYLPPALLDRLRDLARTADLTYADVLVAATAHLDAIAGRFQLAVDPPVPGAMPQRVRHLRRDPGIQTQLRLDGHQVAWLDDAARRTGAPSRSALVVALLENHLTKTEATP
ncbi:MAG: hypothetical protein ACT4QF_20670 [Sporichthyaceae bacterium]